MSRPWSVVALAGAAASCAYPVLPLVGQNVLYNAVGLACVALIAVGLRRHRPERRAPWVLLGLGVLLWVAGDVAYTLYDLPAGDPPFPSWADVLHLAGYPVVALAFLITVRRTGVRDLEAWLDGLIATVCAAALAWVPLLEPLLEAPDTTVAARAVAVAYPLGDLLVLLLVLRLLAGRRLRSGPFGVLAMAVGAYLVADAAYGVLSLRGTYETGSPADFGWLAAYTAIGAVALHPSMVELCAPRPARRATRSRPRLAALILAVLPAPVVLALQELHGDHDDVLPLVGLTTVLLLLVAARVAGLVGELERLARTLRRRESELERWASTDALTGLANRHVLQARLERELAGGGGFSVALLDLDDFKQINDSRGHEAGDALIVAIGQRLVAAVGPGDLVARLGGDEYAVVSARPSTQVAQALLGCFDRPVPVLGLAVDSRVSIGLTDVEPGAGAVDPLRQADIAMYAAKASGGASTETYRPAMGEQLLSQIALRKRLAAAVRDGEFVAWLQPVVDLDSGRLLGFEALARWAPPDRAPAPPAAWMDAAEQTDLIVEIDDLVLRDAARTLARWTAEVPGAEQLTLAVNASGRTLQVEDIAERVLAALDDARLPASRLVLEVTERVLVDDEGTGARLQHLREAGVRIALDDFGTGWSSLGYLRRFPVDVLKVDRSFVQALTTGPQGAAVPAAVVQLARALDLEVVAEGVETAEQAEGLRVLGAHVAQGYLLGRPAPAAALEQVVRRGRVGWSPPPVVIPLQVGVPVQVGVPAEVLALAD